jgi:hypothetical protein
MNPDSSWYFDQSGAIAAGLSLLDQHLGLTLAELITLEELEPPISPYDPNQPGNYPGMDDWETEQWKVWQQTWDDVGVAMKGLEDMGLLHPPGANCGDWRHLDPGPHYVCGFLAPKASKPEVIAALRAEGYIPDAPAFQGGLPGEKYWKPAPSPPGCAPNLKEYVAYVHACNCGWNYIKNTNPEPSMAHGPRPEQYPYFAWGLYAMRWHYAIFKNALATPPQNCCIQ